MLPNGLAIVPGFLTGGVSLVDWQGRINRHLPLPTRRVEGVRWRAESRELYLVRECAGEGDASAQGIVFGVPLWIVHVPDGL